MIFSLLIHFNFVLWVVITYAHTHTYSSEEYHEIKLDAFEFENAVREYELLLINFHAPWCGHCKVIEKTLEAASSLLMSKRSRARIASIDATSAENIDLVDYIGGIDGFPTLAVFKNGQRISDYTGSRTPKDIVDYLELKLGNLVSTVETTVDFYDYFNRVSNRGIFSDSGPVSIVLVLFPRNQNGDDDHQQMFGNLLDSVANKLDMVIFLKSYNIDLYREFDVVENESTLLVFASDRPVHALQDVGPDSFELKVTGRISLIESMTESYLIKNIMRLTQPSVVTYSKQMHSFLQYIPVKRHVLVFYRAQDHVKTPAEQESASVSSRLVDVIEQVAPSYRGSLLFLLVDSHQYQLSQFFEMSPAALPQVVIADMSNTNNMKKYVYEAFVNFHNETSISSLMETEATVSQSVDKAEGESSYNVVYSEIISAFGSVSGSTIFATEPVTSTGPAGSSSSTSPITPRGPNSSNMNVDTMYSVGLLTLYFNAYLSGLVLPTLRSESLYETEQQQQQQQLSPMIAQKGIVNRLVGANFWNMVMMDHSVNFFVVFVSPWCGHCKQMEPVINDLAQYYKSDKTMRVGRLDSTKNDINHESIHIRGYPALFLFLNTDKHDPIEYDGERTVKAMTQFIADERSKQRKRSQKPTQ